MTTHAEIFAQSRAVLLQMRGELWVYRDANRLETSVRVIAGEPSTELDENGQVRLDREAREVELAQTTAEEGIAQIHRGGIFIDAAGEEWPVDALLKGAPGMHAARLSREKRLAVVGRRGGGR